MSNPFCQWTDAEVDAHNLRVRPQPAALMAEAKERDTLKKTDRLRAANGKSESEIQKSTQRLDAPPAKVNLLFNLSASKDEAKLNKTERAYLAHLRSLSLLWIGIQNITVKIADDCRLTPDFCFVGADKKLTIVDVKGFQREDALIKMKVAARLFPMFRFIIVTKQAGGWLVKDVDP